MLFGSFQSITASTTPDLLASPGAAALTVPAVRRRGGTCRPPPRDGSVTRSPALRSIASTQARFGIHQLVGSPAYALLDEVQPRKARVVEDSRSCERVVGARRVTSPAARAASTGTPAGRRRDMLVEEVEREQRMAQVVEHAHEQHEVEPLARARRRRRPKLPELDVEPAAPPRRTAPAPGSAGPSRSPTTRVGAAALHLDG